MTDDDLDNWLRAFLAAAVIDRSDAHLTARREGIAPADIDRSALRIADWHPIVSSDGDLVIRWSVRRPK
ncbi:MAG: hypothetical protein IVW52_12865 [Acidimicrobiales bacterium]|nr:hypothetical protein [Acidimicrobiales bacterium]